MSIAYLADHPEHLPIVAGWVYGYWGHLLPGVNLEMIERRFHTRLNRDALPLTVIGLAEGQPVGTASLALEDMSTRPDLSPWLASVYVVPACRGRGIGSSLVQAAEEAARRLNIARLYLFTPDRQSFYARMGWAPLEQTEYRGESVVIMSKSFVAGWVKQDATT
jgi:N-acetylglutamate synthase-like GNAT family acetyltransferase